MNAAFPCSEPAVPVVDGHVDLVYSLMRSPTERDFSLLTDAPITPEMLSAGNVRLIVGALYCADQFNGPVTAVAHLQGLYHVAQTRLSGLSPVSSRADLAAAYRGQSLPGILTLLENADALVDADIAKWQRAGIVAVGLTHAGENRIGTGNGVKFPAGFTRVGRVVIAELDRLGLVIDVAHLSDPCFWELIDIFRGSLISSHTGFRRFCDLPRNLSDEQVRHLMSRGGIIGVTVNPEMLAVDRRAGLTQVVEQIDWLVQRYGDAQVAIGSDYGGFDMPSEGLEHPGKFQAIAERLIARGYPMGAVENILGNNWYRFYAERLSE